MRPAIRWGGLRARIIAWSFVPTAIILTAVALVSFYAFLNVAELLAVQSNREMTRMAASQLSGDLDEYARLLTSVALNVDISLGNPSHQDAALREAANRLVVFDSGVVILDNYGRVTAAEPARPEIIGQDWSNRPYYRQMVRLPGTVYSDVLEDGPRGARVVVVAVPITGLRGESTGLMVGMFRLGATTISSFYGTIARLRIGLNDEAYLVDSRGTVIYHSDMDHIGENLATRPVVRQVTSGETGAVRTVDSSGREVVASFSPVPATPWGLVSEESLDTVMSYFQVYRLVQVALLVLGVVVPAVVVAFGVRRITQPIADLIGAAQRVAAGDFGQTIAIRTGDELEELGKQFNLMSSQLSESYSQLEQRVEARTHQLAALNAIAAVVSRSLNLKEILTSALDKTLQVTEMDLGGAYRLEGQDADADGPVYLGLMAQHGLGVDLARRASHMPLAGSSVEMAAAAETPLAWPIGEYPDVDLRCELEKQAVQLVVCVPLKVKGKLVGSFCLGTRRMRTVPPEELALLSAIGRQVGMAMDNARLYDQAEHAAALAERTRLARELHDSVTQSLYSVTLYAEAAARLLSAHNPSAAADHLRELRDTAQEALREMRLLIFQLRPPALQRTGLAAALQARLEAVESRGGLQTDFVLEGTERLSPPVQEELYHIAQEALNNALRHAHAHSVRVFLSFADVATRLVVADDGVGFDPSLAPSSGGFGLGGMSERAQRIGASLSISSTPGAGTTVSVLLPASLERGTA